uniref:WD repeat-containing protein 3 n=1 Tax=Tetraodon nigroviridis TaxID=99883 RepID=H3CIA2_TETNG
MGLTKQYLRYVASAVFGVIGSQKANVAYVTLRGGEKGRYVAAAACEHVFIWDVRKGEKVMILEGQKHEVTFLCPSPDGVHVAVGYEDGAVRIFSLLNGESNVSFNGHKSAVSVMRYDGLGARLVTGSKDTDVIVWDIINECGLYRLRGHKDLITQALFLRDRNLLVTSSKDSFVKWWDLDTQHCFKTIVGHRSEVQCGGMVLLDQDNRLLTGSADSELRAWDITYLQEIDESPEEVQKPLSSVLSRLLAHPLSLPPPSLQRILSCHKAGSILREARDRVVSLTTDARSAVIACHANESVLELFRVLPEVEVQQKMKKKEKKAKKKAAQAPEDAAEDAGTPAVTRTLKDEIVRLTNIKASAKIRWAECVWCSGGELKVALLLQNNTVETYSLRTADKTPAGTKTARLTLGGHRTDVRTLAFSSDNLAVLSASGDTVKVWNRATLQVIRTMACEYALCSLFVPGDRQIVLGSESGKLQIFELASAALLESVDAHAGAVWALCLAPDQRGLVTGSADKTVKFWDFELVKDQDAGHKRLTVKHTRTLQLEEDVLCVKLSPDHRLLAVSLLDCTVKLFYADTLKFFLSLYGHKLPVLCLDICHDSTLIATGSADRNVKIWGLDFGDCHRSMFAHDDSVMFLQFVPKTHLFFTAGKDKKIKQWDADKFEHVQTLEGHHREVWCLAISPNGDHLVTASHDKSLRLWERTREPVILEEEREMEREAEFEESMAKGDVPVVPGETPGEAAPAGKKTVETVKAAERIMEALELFREERRKLEDHEYACRAAGRQLPAPKPNPILVAYGNVTPSRYVLDVIKKVRSSELEVSLLVLPFSYVPELLKLFNAYIQQGLEVELVCRCLFFLLRIHFGQISSNQMLLTVMDQLRTNTLARVGQIRDVMGFNSAALQFLQRELESKEEVTFFAEATGKLKKVKLKGRRVEPRVSDLN